MSIDNRIVDMQFNNRQFENGIQTSLKSLDNLKKGLDLDSSARSLSNLERVGRSFSLAGVADGIEKLTNRFSNMGIVGITALQNITNSAINTGRRMLSALTVDPIKTGLQEYETKMNAITTILTNTASKGTTLKEVNATLNELNEYADKTIYNFAEMTRNIGTFTAAGVDLKQSAVAIKGIANLAAGSGSNAQQASTAMYQLSQALASGTVKLMDWNSVVNAGMGGELFQKALEKTARELGHGRDMSVSFRESLESGWITSKVLIKTLEGFAKDESLLKAATQVKTFTQMIDTMKESVQSGWAQSWENIIGDREEAAAFFTAINDGFGNIVGSSAEARNEMLAFWKANGGRNAIIESLSNTFKGLQAVLKPINEAFREIFPPMTGQMLVDISKKIKDISSNFKIGEETATNLKRTFKGLFALLDIGKQAIFALGSGIGSFINYIAPAGGGLLSFTAYIGDYIVKLNNAIKTSNIFNVAIQKIGDFMKPIADGVKRSVGVIIDTFKSFSTIDTSGVDSFTERVRIRFEPFTKLGNLIGGAFQKMLSVIKRVAPVFYKLGEMIGGAFQKIQDNIVNSLDGAEFNSIFDLINGTLFAGILLGLKKFISSLTGITDEAGGFLKGITGILDGVKGSLEAYQSSLKANTLLKIAGAIAILTASLLVLSLIDSNKLGSALAAMSVMFVELFATMALFDKFSGTKGFLSMGKTVVMMMGLSTAILILSVAMTQLAKLDWNGIAKGLTSVAVLSGILVGASKLLSTTSGRLIKGSLGFILFATAINILTTAVEKMSKLDTEGLAKGLIGVGVLAAELALFMKVADIGKMGPLKGLGFIALATSLLILSTAVKTFSEIDAGALIKGLSAMGIALAQLAIFVNLTGNAKRVITTAIGLTILGAAMLIFANTIGTMGNMSMEQIGKGLLTMAGALAIVATAMNFMPKNMASKAVGLVIISSSLIILSKALDNMGGMSWEQIAKGLITLAGSLTIIALAMTFMKTALPGAGALLVIAGALSILTPVLITLGSMSLSEIGKGLLALAGVFTVIGVAGLVLGPLVPVILGLAGAIALLGIGCLAVGAGILAFSAGLTALAVAGTAGTVALVASVTAIVGLIPFILKTLAKGLIDFVKIIGDGAPIIAEAIKNIAKAIIVILKDIIPDLVDALMILLDKFVSTLLEYLPNIIETGMELIIGLLDGIGNNISRVVESAINIVINFLDGIAIMIPKVIQSGIDLVLALINGMAEAIRGNTQPMIDAVQNLIDAIIDGALRALRASITMFITAGKNIIRGLMDGMKSMIKEVASIAGEIGNSVIESAKRALGIHSPSKVFKEEIGEMVGAGMAAGIKSSSKKSTKASAQAAKDATKAAKEVFDKEVESIDERKYYNQLNLDQELKAWENIQKKYKQGSDERKKADREVYRVKKEIIEKQLKMEEDAYKKGFDHSLNWIDDRKYYNELSLMDELDAWERVQKRYAEGSEERKKADREVYRVKKEIIEKQKELEEDYYAKTKEVNDKLKEDIRSVNQEYDDAVESRTQSLYGSHGLFDKIENQEKVDGMDLFRDLQKQVRYFETWQEDLDKLSKRGLDEAFIKELSDMGPKAAAQIDALNALSDSRLNAYVDLWRKKHIDAKTQAVEELEGMRIETANKITQLNADAEIKLNEYRATWTREMIALRVNTQQEFTTLTNGIKNVVSGQDWIGLGSNIAIGISSGIRNSTNMVVTGVVGLVQKALKGVEDVLGINMPFNETLSNMAEVIQEGLEMNPVIRPVMDLANVIAGKNVISDIFGKNQNIGVTSSNKASSISSGLNSTSTKSKDATIQNGSNQTINNEFKIASLVVREESDTKKIAKELYEMQRRNGRPREVLV